MCRHWTFPSPVSRYLHNGRRRRGALLLEQTIQTTDQLFQVDAMFLCKAPLSQTMIGIRTLTVVGGTEGYGLEIRRLL